VLAVIAVGALAWWAWGPHARGSRMLSGYVEGEALYLSSATAGTLSAVSVRRGQRVVAGQPLFVVDAGPLIGQRDQAAAALAAAQARAEDARKGQRPAELSVFDAERAAAQAQLREAQADFNRVETLVRRGIYAPARLDQVRAARDTAAARVREAERRRAAATLGAREDAVAAADAQVAQAQAALREAQSRLDQVSPKAPTAARVQEVFFQPGEWAAPNQPVVALIPDDRVRLRFFVPETEVAKYRVGGAVRFSCDGCAGGRARIDYVSPRPEFTPPVIYSRDTRERMVFMVEARPADPLALNPGQPIDVEPLP
ncbi:MAG TPA: HlyD family efflux transporter periplasmic adaptor subunit, partial [Caulobacteraceae bacterium]|nr:HlyD family efflux transporter periplasmic adaptor subunit [Caulobacteraceae bacterium]